MTLHSRVHPAHAALSLPTALALTSAPAALSLLALQSKYFCCIDLLLIDKTKHIKLTQEEKEESERVVVCDSEGTESACGIC